MKQSINGILYTLLTLALCAGFFYIGVQIGAALQPKATAHFEARNSAILLKRAKNKNDNFDFIGNEEGSLSLSLVDHYDWLNSGLTWLLPRYKETDSRSILEAVEYRISNPSPWPENKFDGETNRIFKQYNDKEKSVIEYYKPMIYNKSLKDAP